MYPEPQDIFWAYASHEQEKEDIARISVDLAKLSDFTAEFSVVDDFSHDDLEDIKEEIIRRLGCK